MPERIKQGDKLPFFRYDTPYSIQQRSRDLLAAKPPLILVFMSNFGHPVTRTFAERYATTFPALLDGSLAMVVRSQPEKLAASIGPDTLPFPLLCDAEGVLYDLLQIPQRSGTLTTYSLEGWRIVREARRQGYRPAKNALQQLPLTLILAADGTVLFQHYGSSLTDVPEDCAAMQQLLGVLGLVPEPEPAPPPDTDDDAPAWDTEELPLEELDPPGDLFAELPPDAARDRLQDPADTLTQGLPLEDLAPELPGYTTDSGEFLPPPKTVSAWAAVPPTPAAAPRPDDPPQPASAPASASPARPPERARRHRPATRRYEKPAAPASSPYPGLDETMLRSLFEEH